MARKATKPEGSSKTINVRMKLALARKIAAIAKAEHRSRNAQIVHMLELITMPQDQASTPAQPGDPARDTEDPEGRAGAS